MNAPEKSLLEWLGYIPLIVLVALLGSLARLLTDHSAQVTQLRDIPKIAWWAYGVSGAASGLLVALGTHHLYGFSPLHLMFCLAAGFGSVQILTTCALLLTKSLNFVIGKR